MQDLPIFYVPDIRETCALPEDEAKHCTRVLRMNVGDKLLITDGKGFFYEAVIAELSKKVCRVELVREEAWKKTWQNELILCVTPTKSIDRIEWLLEKAVEVGVDEVLCIKTKHSERKHIKAERLEKIMVSAMKQSQKAILPKLRTEVPFKEAMDYCQAKGEVLLAHCREAKEDIAQPEPIANYFYSSSKQNYSVFIGPEGDFSVEEVLLGQELGAKPITLGQARLRTETAAFVALNQLHLLESLTIHKN